MKKATLRNGFAAIALIAIAACSAAGGSNSSAVPTAGMGTQSEHASALSPDRRHRHQPTKKKQRSLASAALSIAGAGIELDQFGTSGGLLSGLLHFGHDVAHRRGHSEPQGTCNNGVEYTWSSTGQGQVSQTIEFFYDTGCTQPFNLVTLNATFTQAGGNAQGTQETWDQSGNVVGYQTYTATFTPGVNGGIGEIVVQKTAGTGPSAPPTSQSGFTCLFHTANAIDCGTGVLTTLATEEIGFQETLVGQFVTPSPGPSASPSTAPSGSPSAEPSGSPSAEPSGSPSPSASPSAGPTKSPDWHHGGPPGGGWQGGGPSGLQLQINGTGYTGALGTLTLAAGTPPAWTIGGGTLADTLTGTATIGFGGYSHGHHGGWHGDTSHHHGGGDPGPGAMTSIDLTLVDTADGLTVALTSAGFGKLTGAVTQTSTGQSVATMSLDFSGTGTITYSNGTTDQVQNWIIVTT